MSPHLLLDDCLNALRTMPEHSVDAVVTDPPYGLSFMGKKWDYDVPSIEIWAECLRVLKPGGHLLSFAGTRTQHRMAVRIEDAGFEIRDMIAWVYGNGFPKSHNLNDEWRGWGTALKPALEPITVARKPLVGTVAANVLAHGTGAINVDGCRIGDASTIRHNTAEMGYHGGNRADEYYTGSDKGRWPANLIHDGSAEVLAGFPLTGPAKSSMRGEKTSAGTHDGWARTSHKGFDSVRGHDDTGGSAARFFYCAKASKRDRDEGLEGFEVKMREGAYRSVQDASPHTGDEYEYHRAPRANIHPTVKPTDLMRYLCRLVTPPGGIILDPFMGSGSTGKAAALEGFCFIGVERDPEYYRIAEARILAALSEKGEA